MSTDTEKYPHVIDGPQTTSDELVPSSPPQTHLTRRPSTELIVCIVCIY